MAEAHLDHPGEITWFAGRGPAAVLAPCPHRGCDHDHTQVIAWGPDYDHYTLVACTVPLDDGGCDGRCRAWTAEYPPQLIARDPSLPRYKQGKFSLVDRELV